MAESASDFEALLDGLLRSVAMPNVTNRLGIAEVSDSIAETYREVSKDELIHGNGSAGVFADLIMADWSIEEPALFCLVTWNQPVLRVYCGKGSGRKAIEICDRFSMAEVDECISAMDQEFRLLDNHVSLARPLAESWVAARRIPVS